jgi:hypothetical protein
VRLCREGESLKIFSLSYPDYDGRRYIKLTLASSNRPIHEVLFPPLRDVQYDYEHNFQGMTAEPVPLDAQLAARERMVRELQHGWMSTSGLGQSIPLGEDASHFRRVLGSPGA